MLLSTQTKRLPPFEDWLRNNLDVGEADNTHHCRSKSNDTLPSLFLAKYCHIYTVASTRYKGSKEEAYVAKVMNC